MDSFYGGKPGQSIVLKAHFPYFDDMVDAFKKGEEYKDVWFGEYCIISCPNLNHPDNGKVYRRGFDYQQDDGDAQYVGQIRGPASGTPWFEMTSLADVQEISKRPLDRDGDDGEPWEERSYPYLNGAEVDVYYDDSNSNADPTIHILDFSTKDADSPSAGSLVPGKVSGAVGDIEGSTYNDKIRYTWVNMRTADEDNDSTFYVGFEIPYTVIEFTHTVTAPYKNGTYDESVLDIARTDIGNHPFYELWDVDIAKGIHGDSIRQLKVITLDATHVGTKLYRTSDITYDATDGHLIFGNPSYEVTSADASAKRQILVYEIATYDTYQSPTGPDVVGGWSNGDTGNIQHANNKGVGWVYVGDFNMVDDILLDDDGTLTFRLSYDDDRIFTHKIKWIDYVKLNTDNGQMTLDFNTTPDKDPDETWWLRWVKDIQFDMDKGTITIIYTNDGNGGSGGANQEEVLEAKLRWVKDAKVSDTGVITFGYNTQTGGVQDTFTVKDAENPSKDFHLQHITGVSLSKDANYNEDKRIQVKYNYKDGVANKIEAIGDSINYIQDMAVRPEDFHLLVLFNDLNHRISLTQAESAGIGEGNEVTINGVTWVRRLAIPGVNGGTQTPQDQFWRDYGTIKDDHGLMVGLNVDRSTVAAQTGKPAESLAPEDVISALNKLYPSGLTDNSAGDGEAVRHKVVTFGDETEEKWFYAYDYNKYTWYYVGGLIDTNILDIMILDGSVKPIPYSAYEDLQYGGTALIYEGKIISDEPLPEFWAPDYVDTYFLDDAKGYLDALLDFSIRWHKTDGSDASGDNEY